MTPTPPNNILCERCQFRLGCDTYLEILPETQKVMDIGFFGCSLYIKGDALIPYEKAGLKGYVY